MNAAVVPAMAGNLVACTVDVSDQCRVRLRDLADHEERGLNVALAQQVKNPPRGHVEAVLVVRLEAVVNVESGGGLDAVMLFDVEAEDELRSLRRGQGARVGTVRSPLTGNWLTRCAVSG